MSNETEAYYQQARSRAQMYSHVVYVPPMFEPVDDGFRWTDKDYQKQIDRIVRMTLFEWNLLDRTLAVGSLLTEERVTEVIAWLQTAQSK